MVVHRWFEHSPHNHIVHHHDSPRMFELHQAELLGRPPCIYALGFAPHVCLSIAITGPSVAFFWGLGGVMVVHRWFEHSP